MTISLSNLEKLAIAADQSKFTVHYSGIGNMEEWFNAALTPKTILALVRIAQTAKDLVEGLQRMDFTNVAGACSKCADALEEVTE